MDIFALLFIAVMFGLPVYASVQAKKAKERSRDSSDTVKPLTAEELEFLRSLRDEPEEEAETTPQKSAPLAPLPQAEGQRTINSSTKRSKKPAGEKEVKRKRLTQKNSSYIRKL